MFLFKFILHHVSYFAPTFPNSNVVQIRTLLFYYMYVETLIINGAMLSQLYPFSLLSPAHYTNWAGLYKLCLHAWLWTRPYSLWTENDLIFYSCIPPPPISIIIYNFTSRMTFNTLSRIQRRDPNQPYILKYVKMRMPMQ
jgi:hypothetical protein